VSDWRRFAERIAAAERHLPLGTDRERADAHAYLAGLVRVALEQQQSGADPDHPRFVENPGPASKWGAENADNRYLWAPLRPDATYRVHGHRGTSFELLFETKEGFMQLGQMRNFAARCASGMQSGTDGRFELWLGGAARAGNWMPLDADARWLLVREYFVDWEHEAPAQLAIERIGDAAHSVPTPDRVGAQLDAAATWVEETARCWSGWVAELRAAHEPGKLAPARRHVGGAEDILYGNDWFRLAEDEALVVECAVPDARYWAFQLVDPCFRSLDWSRHQTSLNHGQARIDADGRVRVVVAHRDPGVANWLDTTGLPEGVFQYRFVWARTTPRPVAQVVPVGKVVTLLPDAARSSADARARALAMRRAHAARRVAALASS
jgi:hypothetical protein